MTHKAAANLQPGDRVLLPMRSAPVQVLRIEREGTCVTIHPLGTEPPSVVGWKQPIKLAPVPKAKQPPPKPAAKGTRPQRAKQPTAAQLRKAKPGDVVGHTGVGPIALAPQLPLDLPPAPVTLDALVAALPGDANARWTAKKRMRNAAGKVQRLPAAERAALIKYLNSLP